MSTNGSKDRTISGSSFEEDLSKESAQATTWNQKFDVLIKLIKQGSENGPILSDVDIVDTIFHLVSFKLLIKIKKFWLKSITKFPSVS